MSERTHAMTEVEYLAWEERQELRHEFDGSRPVAMPGSTARHDRVRGNLYMELKLRLRGGSCEPFGPDMRVPTGRGRYRYPDAVVTCDLVDDEALDLTVPAVIFEVLSESTYEIDRGVKLLEYRSIPSLARYVMLEQNAAMATVIARVGDIWSIDVRRGTEVLTLPEVGVELPLRDLYVGVTLSSEPA